MNWFHKRRKETATTVMAELERIKYMEILSQLPKITKCTFDDITEIKLMLNQIIKYLKETK